MVLHRSIVTGLAVSVLFGGGLPLNAQARFEVPNTIGMSWHRGNTHTHTLESDGDSPPEYVVQWYREHGYNFLVLSDHNVFTDPAQLSHLTDSDFILIPGEEVSSRYEGLPVHVNGLNLPGLVDPKTGATLVATIQNNVDAIREVEGVPHVNHPNFRWAFGAKELAQVENDRLLEIHNGFPTANNEGGGGFPSLEEIWDPHAPSSSPEERESTELQWMMPTTFRANSRRTVPILVGVGSPCAPAPSTHPRS